MRKRIGSAAVCAIVVALVPGVANAEEAINLVGTWKGQAIVVQIGSNPYRIAEGTEPNFPTNKIEFTFEVTRQEDNRIAGKSSGGKFHESFIGAISPDNRSGIILDDDGQYDFTVVDASTLNVCYHHSYPNNHVVGCYQIKRS